MRTPRTTCAYCQNLSAANQMGVARMGKKQEIAIGIALQTQVLKTCPIHNQLYSDDEAAADDENMARAFAIAIELVREHRPYAEEFHHNEHELTDLLSDTIGAAPVGCPDCVPQRYLNEKAGEPASAGS